MIKLCDKKVHMSFLERKGSHIENSLFRKAYHTDVVSIAQNKILCVTLQPEL